MKEDRHCVTIIKLFLFRHLVTIIQLAVTYQHKLYGLETLMSLSCQWWTELTYINLLNSECYIHYIAISFYNFSIYKHICKWIHVHVKVSYIMLSLCYCRNGKNHGYVLNKTHVGKIYINWLTRYRSSFLDQLTAKNRSLQNVSFVKFWLVAFSNHQKTINSVIFILGQTSICLQMTFIFLPVMLHLPFSKFSTLHV